MYSPVRKSGGLKRTDLVEIRARQRDAEERLAVSRARVRVVVAAGRRPGEPRNGVDEPEAAIVVEDEYALKAG